MIVGHLPFLGNSERQATAGLSAVHKQKLFHRDIKLRNIMVSVEEGSTVSVIGSCLLIVRSINFNASRAILPMRYGLVATMISANEIIF
jgi:serine/threonine protein kinase